MKTRLQVPKGKEHIVLARGAKYDKDGDYYYVPEDIYISIFNEFIPLTIELIPSSSWYDNVRSRMSDQWNNIRKSSYKKAGYKCEVCGDVGPKHPVECHEIWEFNVSKKIQKLVGLVSLCPSCHKVKHMGLAFIQGNQREAIEHLKKINNWSDLDAGKYIEEAFQIHDILSETKWELDLSYVETK